MYCDIAKTYHDIRFIRFSIYHPALPHRVVMISSSITKEYKTMGQKQKSSKCLKVKNLFLKIKIETTLTITQAATLFSV